MRLLEILLTSFLLLDLFCWLSHLISSLILKSKIMTSMEIYNEYMSNILLHLLINESQ